MQRCSVLSRQWVGRDDGLWVRLGDDFLVKNSQGFWPLILFVWLRGTRFFFFYLGGGFLFILGYRARKHVMTIISTKR